MDLAARYQKRASRHWRDRLIRLALPPEPFILNPAQPKDFPMGRWNLYIGGADRIVQDFVNIDIVAMPGVDVAADAEQLPFPSDLFQRVECDAVLEHVRDPERVMREIQRVLSPGGYVHLVTPFCHPYHEYPKDFRRFTIDGLKELAGPSDPAGDRDRVREITSPLAAMADSRACALRMAAVSASIAGLVAVAVRGGAARWKPLLHLVA